MWGELADHTNFEGKIWPRVRKHYTCNDNFEIILFMLRLLLSLKDFGLVMRLLQERKL